MENSDRPRERSDRPRSGDRGDRNDRGDRDDRGGRGGGRYRRDYQRPPRIQPQKERKKFTDIKIFGKWTSEAEIKDIGLKKYINIDARVIPRSAGIHRRPFHKSRMHIIERLALHLLVSGHQGKRHRISSGRFGGNFYTILRSVEKALDIVEKKEGKNPIQILVSAVENAAIREEIISYQMGSIMAREAVISSPQRRVDKALRIIAQSSYRKAFSSKTHISLILADEVIAAARGSGDSVTVKERERIEREASGAR